MSTKLHRGLRYAAYAAAIGVFVGLVSAPNVASAADQSVSVDMSSNLGAPNYKASGFLYGLSQDATAPAGAVLSDAKPKLFRGGAVDVGCGWNDTHPACVNGAGYATRFAEILAQANRAKSLGANYQWLLSDTWNDNNTTYPGDGGWSAWTAFLTQVVHDKIANNLTNVRYDIWNEPDGSYFWPRDQATYNQMWITAVQTIRSLDPNAVIVGPGYSTWNMSALSSWLDMAKSNNVLPNIVDMHFSTDPVSDVASVESMLSSKSITSVTGVTIGEYIRSAQENSGYTAWYLSRMQQSDALGGNHGLWNSCCSTPDMSDVLSGGKLTGQWWSYAAYGSMTGQLVSVADSADIAGAASTDSSRSSALVMLGNDGSLTGNVTVNINNLNSTSYLVSGGKVHVVVSEITNGSPQAAPVVSLVTDATVSSSNSISVLIPWTDATNAYTISLTPYNSAAPVGQVLVNNDNPAATYTGSSWTYQGSRGFGDYNDDVEYATTNGDSATFSFTGTSVRVIGERYPSPDQGNVLVSIDGGTATTVSTTASSRQVQQVIYTSPTLSPGAHTVTVTKSTGTYMVLDAFAYTPSNQMIEVNDTTPNAVYTGSGWHPSTGRGFGDYNDDVHYTANIGDYVTYTFTGTSVQVIGEKDPTQGNVLVSVDGGTATTLDTSAPSKEAQQAIYTSPTLSAGTHTVKLTMSTGYWMTIDAFITPSSDPPIEVNATPSTTVEAGTGWHTSGSRGFGDLNDDVEYTTVNGDSMSFTFTGTSVQVIGEKYPSPSQGNVLVSIDGGASTTVDTTSSSRLVQQAIYTSPTLSSGSHTITITKSTGTYMVIDAFKYQ